MRMISSKPEKVTVKYYKDSFDSKISLFPWGELRAERGFRFNGQELTGWKNSYQKRNNGKYITVYCIRSSSPASVRFVQFSTK